MKKIKFLFLLIFLLVAAGIVEAQTCTAPPVDLVSWWPGDGNADDIIGNNHGTLVNGATFAAGKVGKAFSLDGDNDYVATPLLNTEIFTWETILSYKYSHGRQ